MDRHTKTLKMKAADKAKKTADVAAVKKPKKIKELSYDYVEMFDPLPCGTIKTIGKITKILNARSFIVKAIIPDGLVDVQCNIMNAAHSRVCKTKMVGGKVYDIGDMFYMDFSCVKTRAGVYTGELRYKITNAKQYLLLQKQYETTFKESFEKPDIKKGCIDLMTKLLSIDDVSGTRPDTYDDGFEFDYSDNHEEPKTELFDNESSDALSSDGSSWIDEI